MERTIYQNNECKITAERVNSVEYKINVNGQNLIWVSIDSIEQFEEQLKNLLDEHRI